MTVCPHQCTSVWIQWYTLWYIVIAEPDEGTSRILYISDEAISGLVRTNGCWCVRLRHIYQWLVHQLTVTNMMHFNVLWHLLHAIVKWLIYLIVVLLWHLVLIKFGSSWHKILRSDCFYHWKSVYKAHDECCKNLLIRCCDAALFEWTSCSCSIFHNVSTSTGCKLSLQLYWLVVVTVLLWEN